MEMRGCALERGLPVVYDTCLGTALHADGTPLPGAWNVDGAMKKCLTYSKRVGSVPLRFGYVAADRKFGHSMRRGEALRPNQRTKCTVRLMHSLLRTKVATVHASIRLPLLIPVPDGGGASCPSGHRPWRRIVSWAETRLYTPCFGIIVVYTPFALKQRTARQPQRSFRAYPGPLRLQKCCKTNLRTYTCQLRYIRVRASTASYF